MAEQVDLLSLAGLGALGRSDVGHLPTELGRLAARQFESRGLSPVAAKVAAGQLLMPVDLVALSEVPLPVLGKLVELAGHRPPPIARPPVERLVVCPLGSLLESRDMGAAIEEARKAVAEQLDTAATEGCGLLALDRWPSHESPLQLLVALRRVLKAVADQCRLRPLGPPSWQVRHWLAGDTDEARHRDLAGLLHDLRAAGIDTLVGGDDLEIHAAAVAVGFHVIVSQPLGEAAAFCRRLVESRERLAVTGHFVAWQPELRSVLDGPALSGDDPSRADDPSGVEVLRAIALARLALPPHVGVRAPLATLGGKTAHTALSFGASHWGHVAATARTAEMFHLPGPDTLADLIESDVPTPATDAQDEGHDRPS